MKSIDTLVEDIYSLFDEGIDVDDKIVDELASSIAATIKSRMSAYKVKKDSYLRPSNLGKKDRQVYYEVHNYPKEELSPPTKIKFLYGDILEHVLVFFAKAAGHTVTGEQEELTVNGIKGTRDCVIDGVTVDAKSASSYAFRKFKEGKLAQDDSFGYIPQLSFYTEGDKTTDQDVAAFLVINKESGQICLSKIEAMDMPNIPKRIESLKNTLDSVAVPKRCYEDEAEGLSGNRKLCIQCSYCPFKETCWEDANEGKGLKKYIYSNGIKYLTKVLKEPRVSEHV